MNSLNLIITLFMLVGGFGQIELLSINREDQTWIRQLDMIKERNQTIKESVKGNMGIPQLLSYKYIGEIKTLSDASQVKTILMSDDSYFPLSNDATLDVLTLKDLKSLKSKQEFTGISTALNKLLERLVQVGYGKVELTWKHHSFIFKTLCIVSDNGVVYDNIITNIMLASQVEEQSGPVRDSGN